MVAVAKGVVDAIHVAFAVGMGVVGAQQHNSDDSTMGSPVALVEG